MRGVAAEETQEHLGRRAPSPVARGARDDLSRREVPLARGGIIGSNNDYSSSGMFLRPAFGYVLWGALPYRRMPLPGLQAENG